MADNNGGAAGAAGSGEGGARTFTQEEVNAMIGRRVNEVTSKYADYEDLKTKAGKYDEIQEGNKTELQKATERAVELQKKVDGLTREKTVREAREKVSKELGIPAELLTGEDEDTCKKQAEAILNFAKPKQQKYPGTKRNENNKGSNSAGSSGESMREFARQLFGNGD